MTKNEFQRYDPAALYLVDNTRICAKQTCPQDQWRQILVSHFNETNKCHFFHMPRQANLDDIINYKNNLEQKQNVDGRALPAEYALESTSANRAQFKSRVTHQYYVTPTKYGLQVFTKNGEGKVTKHADGGRPISNRVTPLEHSWYILTQSHEVIDQNKHSKHRNRDDTYAEVQKLTCTITKALVRSFVDNCATCSGKSVTKSARAGWDTKKRRAEWAGDNAPSPETRPKRQRRSSKSLPVAPENMEAPLPLNHFSQQPGVYQQEPQVYGYQPGAYQQQLEGIQVNYFMQQQPDVSQYSMQVDPALEQPLDDFLEIEALADIREFLNEFNFSIEENQPGNDLPQDINQTSANLSTPITDEFFNDFLEEHYRTYAEPATAPAAHPSEKDLEVTPEFNNTANPETTTTQQPAPQEVDLQKELEAHLLAEFDALEHAEAEPTTEPAHEEAMSADEYKELFGEDSVDTP